MQVENKFVNASNVGKKRRQGTRQEGKAGCKARIFYSWFLIVDLQVVMVGMVKPSPFVATGVCTGREGFM